ncbi:MAG: P-loop NTPase fold protein [Sneathiella sp.]
MANSGSKASFSRKEGPGQKRKAEPARERPDIRQPEAEERPLPAASLRELTRRVVLFSVLFMISLLALVYGASIYDGVRENPFSEQVGLWEKIVQWDPHPALANLPVVPAGAKGTLVYRPKNLDWLTWKTAAAPSAANAQLQNDLDLSQQTIGALDRTIGKDPVPNVAQQQAPDLRPQQLVDRGGQPLAQRSSNAALPQGAPGENEIRSAYCRPNGLNCWIVGTEGMIRQTEDGGETWRDPNSYTGQALNAVYFNPSNKGLVVAGSNIVGEIDWDGKVWQRSQNLTGDTYIAILVEKDGLVSGVLDEHGGVHDDLGPKFSLLPSDIKPQPLNAGFLVNENVIWVVGDGGVAWTLNGGSAKAGQRTIFDTGVSNDLTSVYFQQDGKIGWITGKSEDPNAVYPLILQTLDGGQTWETLSYRHTPPLWALYIAFPLLLLSGIGAFVSLRQIRYAKGAAQGIEGVASTDKPIGWHDPDHLKIKPLAKAISRFLRNENTRPPLTIAITGEWGKGKSSLMNLISADLQRYDTYPVWFNAWHHQKEEHLLAALLENIRAQAFPGWWRLSGLSLRAHLIWRRSQRDFKAILALIVFASATALLIFLGSGVLEPFEALKDVISGYVTESFYQKILAGFGVGGGLFFVIALVLRFARKLQIVPLNPASLMATVSKRASVGQFREQLGFRYQFAAEFEDICIAMRQTNRTGMVIMIDDLDRCRPESVLEVLEAVNFLVTAGPCFIFLGIDAPKVRDAVAFGFKDSVLNLSDFGEEAPSSLQVDVKDLTRFADNYLKKLINIPVAVPTLNEEASRDFANAPDQRAEITSPWPERIRTSVRHMVDCLGALIIIVATGYLLFQASLLLSIGEAADDTNVPKEEALVRQIDRQLNEVLEVKPTEGVATSEGAAGADVERPSVSADSLTGERLDILLWLFLILVPLPLAYLLKRVTMEPDETVRDTKSFRDALQIWNRAVFASNPTPRDMKRYHNRLRFNAMRLRRDGPVIGWLEKLFKVTRGSEPAVIDIPEPTLVALGAVESFLPDLIDGEKLFNINEFENSIRGKLKDLNGSSSVAEAPGGESQDILTEFTENFPDFWPPSAEQIRQYRELSRVLDTRHPDALISPQEDAVPPSA